MNEASFGKIRALALTNTRMLIAKETTPPVLNVVTQAALTCLRLKNDKL